VGEKAVVDRLGVHGFDLSPGLHSQTVLAALVSAAASTAIATSARIVARRRASLMGRS
jgi:hypothetical protein